MKCKECSGIADSLNDKALLADVKVGDWVEFNPGKKQVESLLKAQKGEK